MTNLKEYMLIFRLPATNQTPTAESIAEMQKNWGVFIGNIASKARLVSTTRLNTEHTLLGATVQQPQNQLAISGNMLVKAENFEEATNMAQGCPVLKEGGSVEVRGTTPLTN